MDGLQHLTNLVEKLAEKQALVEECRDRLKQAEEELRELSSNIIPEYFEELGIDQIKLESGQKVSVKQVVKPRVLDDSFYQWLRDHDMDDIVKNTMSLSFDKGQDELAEATFINLVDKGLTPTRKVAVHPMTLQKVIKEELAKGTVLPESVDVYIYNETKISKR